MRTKQPTYNNQSPKLGTVTVKLNKATVMCEVTHEQGFLEAIKVAREKARQVNAEYRFHQHQHDTKNLPF